MFAKLKKKIETDDAASPGKIGRAESGNGNALIKNKL